MPPKKKLKIDDAAAENAETKDAQVEEEGAPAAEGGEAAAGTSEDAGQKADVEMAPAAPAGPKELEADALLDKRPKLKEPVVFHTPDTTLNVMPATLGGMLMTLNEGGLQFFLAGARASVGISSGRYMFEAKIVENQNQYDTTNGQVRPSVGSRNLLRMGFTTAGGALLMGDGDDSICIDSEGNLHFNRKKTMVSQRFGTGDTVAILLNLDAASPNANTISFFKEGKRVAEPQALPDTLKGKVLYPTLTWKNLSLHVNFGPLPHVALPFKCAMVADAAQADTVVTPDPSPKDGKYQILFPTLLPEEGSFDWLDWYLKKNPSFTEVSDRTIVDWAVKSGLWKPKPNPFKASLDKPDVNFGVPQLDDGSVKRVLMAASTVQQRNLVIMEVQGNLMKQDRIDAVKKYRLTHYKRVAKVMMGEPTEEYKKHRCEVMLREKQAKADQEFAVQKAEKKRKRAIEIRHKQVEIARKKADRIKAKQEAEKKKAEAEKKAAEETGDGEGNGEEAEEKKEGEEAKEEAKEATKEEGKAEAEEEDENLDDEEPAMEVEEDNEEPPKVELTEDEKQDWFKKTDQVKDINQLTLASCFSKFTLPEDGEGFDSIEYEWQSAKECQEHMTNWVRDRKLTTRIEDLTPSEWFREKWQAWQHDLQAWHVKHMEFKDPNKRSAATATPKAAAKPPEKAEEQAGEEKKNGSDENKPPTENAAKDDKDEEKDPMKQLEEELEKAELDIFGLDSVLDVGGGEPLFSTFTFEDWALLSLRFELHLLVHAFKHDCKDPERTGICPEHLAFYYNKYFKKGLNFKNYGVDSMDDLFVMVRDTVIMVGKVLESQLSDDLEGNETFVKLTEESRRERQRRIDSGDQTAVLKFQSRGVEGAAMLSTIRPAIRPSMQQVTPAIGTTVAPRPKGAGLGFTVPAQRPPNLMAQNQQQQQGGWGTGSWNQQSTPRPVFPGIRTPGMQGVQVPPQQRPMMGMGVRVPGPAAFQTPAWRGYGR